MFSDPWEPIEPDPDFTCKCGDEFSDEETVILFGDEPMCCKCYLKKIINSKYLKDYMIDEDFAKVVAENMGDEAIRADEVKEIVYA